LPFSGGSPKNPENAFFALFFSKEVVNLRMAFIIRGGTALSLTESALTG